MSKIKAMICLLICMFLTLGAGNTFAVCEKNEIFSAYGFYGKGGFPENTVLYGPYINLEECERASENYKKSKGDK